MADLRFVLPGPDMITLSGQTADKLIRAGDGDAVLLYLFVLRTGGALSGREAAGALNCTVGDIKRSMELLGRLGLLKCGETPPAPQKDELPEYTAEDIRRELDNGTVFSSLVQEAQKSLGKLLSSDDLVKLFGIYDSLGLPPEVILHLITYCIDENRRRYGPSRVPTMRYIEKTAYTWEREGIFTLEQAEQYLKLLESRKTQIADIKRVLQIRDRELTSGELKYLEGWLSAGFTPEIVEIAYDRTVMRTGKLSWSYMDRILGDWRQKGFRSAEEILQKDTKAAPHAAQQKKPPKSPEADLADIERMKKYLQKLREE